MSPTIFCPGCGEGLPPHLTHCPACATALPKISPETSSPDDATAPLQQEFRPPHRWMETQEPPRPVVPLAPTLPLYQPPARQQQMQPSPPPCPGCGRAIPYGASFCPQCGRNLQAARATPQGFQPTQQAFAPPAATRSFSQRSTGEQLLIIILAVIAACVILGFFC